MDAAAVVRAAGRGASRVSRTSGEHRHDLVREDRAGRSGSTSAARTCRGQPDRQASGQCHLYPAPRPPRRDRGGRNHHPSRPAPVQVGHRCGICEQRPWVAAAGATRRGRAGWPPRDARGAGVVFGGGGPRFRPVLGRVADGHVSEDGFPFMQARDIRIEGFDVFAQRVTYVGELGWEFYLEPRFAMQVWDRLMAAGQTVGIRPGGYRALDSLRMEKGYRYYGTDLTLLDNPLDAG